MGKKASGEIVSDPLIEEGSEDTGADTSAEGTVADEQSSEDPATEEETDKEVTEKEETDADVVEEQKYTPALKYKVLGEEKEMPEWVKPLIKTEEDEKRYKDLFEKADAIDHFKGSNKEIREKYSAVEGELTGLRTEIHELGNFVKKGDFESFFERLEIKPDDVLMWAVKYAELKQNPHQFQAYQANRQREMQYMDAQRRASEAERGSEEKMIEFIRRDAQVTLSDPENQSYEMEFDRRVGRRGAFREEIAARGDRAYGKGQMLTTAEIIREIKGLYSFGGGAATPAAGKQAPVVNKPRPPVIPSVGGSSRSPVGGKKPMSIEELRQLSVQDKGE